MERRQLDKKLDDITKKIDSASDAIQSLYNEFSSEKGLEARLIEKILLERLYTLSDTGVKIEELKILNSAE